MSRYAVAVQSRATGVLLAAADDAGIRHLAAAPPGTAPDRAVADWFGDDPPAVVVRVGPTPGGAFPGAPRVVSVPVGVAVLAAGAPVAGPVLVVDTGPGGADPDAALVDGARVVPVTCTRVAESGAVAARSSACAVVLSGEGVADDPGLAGAIAASSAVEVWTAGTAEPDHPAAVPGAAPDTVAVLGAALLGAGLVARADAGRPSGRATIRAAGIPAGDGRAGPGPARGPGRSEPDAAETAGPVPDGTGPGPHDRLRSVVPAVALLGIALVVAGLLLGHRAAPVTATAAVVVQYGYSSVLPARWEHTGGDPERRRVLLTPAGRPDGADLIVVERGALPYDAGREPDRVRRELTALLAGQDGVGAPETATVAGRPVLRWSQRPGDGTIVGWHVLLDAPDQLSVGCRRPEGAAPAAACAEVVGSVRPTG